MSLLATPRESFTDEERVAIEAQLERVLANHFFSHSRRFPSFLRYVVHETLTGNADSLKERTLGIEIFGKHADYDTASDPIVRVTAAEIRKRIAQYYQDPGHGQELRMSLPPGTYVPHFEFPSLEPVLSVTPEVEPDAEPPAANPEPDPETAPGAGSPAATMGSSRKLWAVAGVAGLLLVAGLLAPLLLWQHRGPSAFAEFWEPILGSNDPVLFCVADQTQYTAISLRDAADPTRQVTLKDNLTAIIIDDLSAITKIAGVLQSAGKHYRLLGEDKTTLNDLRSGPSVIIGAFDNAWALRLLQPLRYHFANDPGMKTFSIIDGSAPQGMHWTVDRSQQIATNNYRDYGIVARFTDDTTGQPTLVAAGISRGGTIAAGEFLTSPELLQLVRSKRPSANAKNVEVVLSTQIIDGEPGTPTVEAVYYW